MNSKADERNEIGWQTTSTALPLVYDELRRYAAKLTSKIPPGQTLQPTALVHEAFLRLMGDKQCTWEGRRHFFGAAAMAMRNILVERARRKIARKHGAGKRRIELSDDILITEPPATDLLAIDESIEKLRILNCDLAELVVLRFYAGLSVDELAVVVGKSPRTIARDWRYAKAWLGQELSEDLAEEQL